MLTAAVGLGPQARLRAAIMIQVTRELEPQAATEAGPCRTVPASPGRARLGLEAQPCHSESISKTLPGAGHGHGCSGHW